MLHHPRTDSLYLPAVKSSLPLLLLLASRSLERWLCWHSSRRALEMDFLWSQPPVHSRMLILVPVPLSSRRILEWVFWRDLRTRLQRLHTSPLEPSPLGAGVFRKVLKLSLEKSVAYDLLDITSVSWWWATVETRGSCWTGIWKSVRLWQCPSHLWSRRHLVLQRLGGSRGIRLWYVRPGRQSPFLREESTSFAHDLLGRRVRSL